MKSFIQLVLVALTATVGAKNLQKRDLSLFQAYLRNATADFVAVDNAIIGVANQLNTTQQFFRQAISTIKNQPVLTLDEARTLLVDFYTLKSEIYIAMGHLAERREVVQKSSECRATILPLLRAFTFGTIFFTSVSRKIPSELKPLAKSLSDDMMGKILDQYNTLSCDGNAV
ncbi:hypothetical protein LMH87_003154 [Akanthomyces muscarius]|uniref:Uncharacterized protein n=1 Tax=Akanthomyces muscarius TaxID=2231603 RepID=A0A9W8Q2S4_AKAMU|nr:hypothetical protein LMH87_003154 [Akanthomyces muscarius]KAJ4144264.1 hypothetical protein LMH87_003154 [Akanthomyces muscarius]